MLIKDVYIALCLSDRAVFCEPNCSEIQQTYFKCLYFKCFSSSPVLSKPAYERMRKYKKSCYTLSLYLSIASHLGTERVQMLLLILLPKKQYRSVNQTEFPLYSFNCCRHYVFFSLSKICHDAGWLKNKSSFNYARMRQNRRILAHSQPSDNKNLLHEFPLCIKEYCHLISCYMIVWKLFRFAVHFTTKSI